MDAEMLYKFKLITGLPETEIIAAVSALPLEGERVLNFYMYHGRWPEPYEADFIEEAGESAYYSLVSRNVILWR